MPDKMSLTSNEPIGEDLLCFVKKLGIMCRHPHDPFYKEANDICQPIKPFGICEYESEDFFHKPYLPFACHIPGCTKTFETVMQFETHYNSCHTFTCKECKKNYPNYHLLDLHISETHDSFFIEMAKRKPMFQCFVPECKDVFQNPKIRHNHCVEVHKFPGDFRFDDYRKTKGNKSKRNNDGNSAQSMDTGENRVKNKSKSGKTFKSISFGQSRGTRKPVFYNFSRDLMNSLPES